MNSEILTKSIDPVKLLRLYNSDEFEELIREWNSTYLNIKYQRVERVGGPRDKGRDVICTVNKETGIWDNYQCKHYDHPLQPNMVWVEIGKLIYYAFNKEYPPPRKYYFMSPCGVGTDLRDLLEKPEKLKEGVISNWEKHCQKRITEKETVVLDGEFLLYLQSFDYSIFGYLSPHEFIEQFKNTPHFTKRFGKLHKPRPIPVCPAQIQENELTYIKKILDAYGEEVDANLVVAKELEKYPALKTHFDRQREYFFSADYLKAYSRDTYDPDANYFDKLKQEVYDGIIEEIEEDAKNGFERLKKVLKRAEQISITGNPLKDDLEVRDRKGICHHLANEREDIKWIK